MLNGAVQECNAHIRLQMQQLADSQAVEATAFLEQVGVARPHASLLACATSIGGCVMSPLPLCSGAMRYTAAPPVIVLARSARNRPVEVLLRACPAGFSAPHACYGAPEGGNTSSFQNLPVSILTSLYFATAAGGEDMGGPLRPDADHPADLFVPGPLVRDRGQRRAVPLRDGAPAVQDAPRRPP